MYHKIRFFLPLFFLCITPFSANAADQVKCTSDDRPCILRQMITESAKIDNQAWRDQSYREIAKTYASDGAFNDALAIIDHINTPDTKAMTIRGIGMAIAAQDYKQDAFNSMFTALRTEAEKIEHPASYAIALTYIAMSQAFAGDNDGAWKTASDMENDALRHKAYAETAEIQAEKGDYASASKSIEFIESEAFKNKAYSIVSKILADSKLYADSYAAANAITNEYKKTQALQYLLDAQKPRDVLH